MTKTRSNLARYGGALVLVLAVHVLAVVLTLKWSVPQAVELPPAAMMVEMAPLPEPPPPPPPPKVVQPPVPVEEPPLPKLAEAPKPKIAVAKPKPKPKPQPPKPEKKPEPKPEPKEEVAETPPPKEAPKIEPQQRSVPGNSQAKRTWQSDLLMHLAKYKKYPPQARSRRQEGTNRLRFVVDANGKVLSYEITGPSGSSILDRATLEMIRRAGTLPKPPAELLTNGTIEIVAPFVYSLKDAR